MPCDWPGNWDSYSYKTGESPRRAGRREIVVVFKRGGHYPSLCMSLSGGDIAGFLCEKNTLGSEQTLVHLIVKKIKDKPQEERVLQRGDGLRYLHDLCGLGHVL